MISTPKLLILVLAVSATIASVYLFFQPTSQRESECSSFLACGKYVLIEPESIFEAGDSIFIEPDGVAYMDLGRSQRAITWLWGDCFIQNLLKNGTWFISPVRNSADEITGRRVVIGTCDQEPFNCSPESDRLVCENISDVHGCLLEESLGPTFGRPITVPCTGGTWFLCQEPGTEERMERYCPEHAIPLKLGQYVNKETEPNKGMFAFDDLLTFREDGILIATIYLGEWQCCNAVRDSLEIEGNWNREGNMIFLSLDGDVLEGKIFNGKLGVKANTIAFEDGSLWDIDIDPEDMPPPPQNLHAIRGLIEDISSGTEILLGDNFGVARELARKYNFSLLLPTLLPPQYELKGIWFNDELNEEKMFVLFLPEQDLERETTVSQFMERGALWMELSSAPPSFEEDRRRLLSAVPVGPPTAGCGVSSTERLEETAVFDNFAVRNPGNQEGCYDPRTLNWVLGGTELRLIGDNEAFSFEDMVRVAESVGP